MRGESQPIQFTHEPEGCKHVEGRGVIITGQNFITSISALTKNKTNELNAFALNLHIIT